MSCGSVYSVPSYMILVGDVRVLLLDDGRMELSNCVCAVGLLLCLRGLGCLCLWCVVCVVF